MLIDYLNLMCYDFSGPWTPLSGHQSQLRAPTEPHDAYGRRSCDSGIAYVLSRGVPRHKVVLGVPVYGRSFLGATGPGQKFSGGGGEQGVFEYRDLPRPGTVEKVDRNVCAAYCVGGDGGFVTYDNPVTVMIKGDYAKREGLGGLFYWTATADAQGDRSLIVAGHRSLESK